MFAPSSCNASFLTTFMLPHLPASDPTPPRAPCWPRLPHSMLKAMSKAAESPLCCPLSCPVPASVGPFFCLKITNTSAFIFTPTFSPSFSCPPATCTLFLLHTGNYLVHCHPGGWSPAIPCIGPIQRLWCSQPWPRNLFAFSYFLSCCQGSFTKRIVLFLKMSPINKDEYDLPVEIWGLL